MRITAADAGCCGNRGLEGIVLHDGVERHRSCTTGLLTVAHDGARCIGGVVRVSRAIAFEVGTVVDGATGPAAPVGVVGSAVVSDLVGHNVGVPGEGGQVEGGFTGHIAGNAAVERAIAQGAEVGDTAGSDIGAQGEKVLQVNRNGREIGIGSPLIAEGRKDTAAVIGDGEVGIRGDPDMNDPRLERHDFRPRGIVEQLGTINLIHR